MSIRRHRVRVRWPLAMLLAALVLASTACIHVFWRTEARAVTAASGPATTIRTPVRAHLADGSTLVFAKGAEISGTDIRGVARRFTLLNDVSEGPAELLALPLDSVVGLETFEGQVRGVETVVASLAATAAGAVALAGLAIAIFGSCPTLYADTGTGLELEAEGFSYAIAPLMEHRDIDPLRVRPGSDGTMRLELRNEALETHYLNQVEVLAVRHEPGAVVVPDQAGGIVTLSALQPLTRATDRSGRDVRAQLRAHDGELYATDPQLLARATADDFDDWIDVEARDLPPGDSVAIVLRLRNSLLNTVLLYDGMLSGRDATEWLSTGLRDPRTALELAAWYTATMGLHATVEGHPVPAPRSVRSGHARLADVGPIAFRDVALVLPRAEPNASTVKVRLRFVADNWRIDQAQVSGRWHRAEVVPVPLARVIVPTPGDGGPPRVDTAALRALAATDDVRLETRPGQRMSLEFDVPLALRGDSASAGTATTRYLVQWRGWYREWMRPDWLRTSATAAPFVPGDAAAFAAITRWRVQQHDFERDFYASRIPVR